MESRIHGDMYVRFGGRLAETYHRKVAKRCGPSLLKSIMKDLHIEKEMIFHRARHSFRTIAAKKGIRDGIAERIMGHAEGNEIKDIYIHLHDEDIIKEMIDKWIV